MQYHVKHYPLQLHLEFSPVTSSVWSDRSRAREVAVIAVLIDVSTYTSHWIRDWIYGV